MSFACSINGCPHPAVRVWYMPNGCYCQPDKFQGLCEQHEISTEADRRIVVELSSIQPQPKRPWHPGGRM